MNSIPKSSKRGLSPILLLLGLALLAGNADAAQDVITASGTWTAPAGVTSVTVEVWGGGGAGGGNSTTVDGGGGGGGGGYSMAVIAVTPGNNYTVVVGAGGTGVTGGNGNNGGQSYFIDAATVMANGGAGGAVPVDGNGDGNTEGGIGGAGGAAGVGTTTFTGGNGGTGRDNNTGRGGPGGSSAGTAANGTSGPAPYSGGGGGTGTTAQPPPAGGGIGGNGGASGANGSAPASGNGGGGGGSGDKTLIFNRTGGSGAGGKVVISYPTIPVVISISLASTDPTAANTAVSWTVVFDQSVTGVDAGDFVLVESNGAAGSSLTSVSGGGAIWTVTANTGTGASGLLGLNLVDNDSILSIDSLPLGGAGAGNGNFTGAVYTIAFTPRYVFTNGACTHNIAIGGGGCTAITWSPQVAGQALGNIYITNVNAAGTPRRLNATNPSTLNIAFRLACYDPATGAGMSATFSATSMQCSPTVWSAAKVVTFPGGSPSAGPYSFIYDDVGKIELWMRDSAATTRMGASGSFVVAPDHFGFSGVTAAPIKAGNNFAATVTAYNGLATPTATANFGKEAAPESVTLTFTKCQPTGINAVNGTFTGNVGAFAGGAASAANLNWSEVGNGDLVATNNTYLNSTLSPTGNTGTGGTACNGVGGAGNVGRFIPDHFVTTVTDSCPGGGFTYSGQPFTIGVTAMNGLAVPTTTQNYDGTGSTSPNFSKGVTLTAWDAATGLIPDPNGALTNTAIPATDFTQGVATINATNVGPATLAPVFTFTSRTTAPTQIRIRSVDTDAATSSGFSEGTTWIRSGRAKLGNAHGSELLALPVPFRTEYWNNGWVLNSADNCSGDNSAGGTVSVTLSAAPATCVQDSGNPGLSGAGCAAAGPAAQQYKEGAGLAGNFNLNLSAPGSGNTGAVTVTGNVPTWLQYPWGGGAAVDPSSLATFGVYKGSSEFIYMRENY